MARKRSDRELEDVLRRAYALSERDQLRLYEHLRTNLALGAEQETEIDRELAERAAALEALAQVAEHLGLPEGTAPTTTQFKQAVAKLGLDWSVARVGRVFGRWRFAQQALSAERSRITRAQRRHRRATAGRRRDHETYLSGLRIWLESDSPGLTAADYDDFVAAYNDRVPDGEAPIVGLGAVISGLSLSFTEAVRVAKGEADYEQILARHRERVEAGDPGSLRLVGTGAAAVMLKKRSQELLPLRHRSDFPTPVARVGRDWAWLLEDIEAYRAKQPLPEREEGELQERLLASSDLAALLHLHIDSLRTLLSNNDPRVPPPSGRVGVSHYWVREEVEEWLVAQRGTANDPDKRLARRRQRLKRSR